MAVSIEKAAEKRRRDLAAIHASTKQLGIDRDAYEDLLERVTGKRSSADLDSDERGAVLRELRRLGACKPRPAGGSRVAQHPGKPHNFDTGSELLSKIEAQLAEMKLPWSYADAIGKRMHGIARIAWLRDEEQLRSVVAALYVEQGKRNANEFIDSTLKRLGWEPEQLVELFRPLRPNWRRHRASLELVVRYLTHQLACMNHVKGDEP